MCVVGALTRYYFPSRLPAAYSAICLGTYVRAEYNAALNQSALFALKNLTFPPDLLPTECDPRIPGYLYLPQPIVLQMAYTTSGNGTAYKYHNLVQPFAAMIPQMAHVCSQDPQCVAFDDQVSTAAASRV